jgi:hypothetical protein
VYPGTLSDALAAYYTAQGFEVSVHVKNGPVVTTGGTQADCGPTPNFTPSGLDSDYLSWIGAWVTAFPSLARPATHRMHCVEWSDWVTQALVELKYGIRLDTTYYYWPSTWINDRPGMFTGSGMPMRFANTDGTMIDVYQATSQLTDESGQTYPFEISTLLNNAVGAAGYYGAFTANMHTDNATSAGSDSIVATAQSLGVPVVSANQMLRWLDGRNGSFFGSITWNANVLSFTVTPADGSRGLLAMLPTTVNGKTLSQITFGGSPVSFSTQTIKGITYAVFPAAGGAYQATYQ